MQIKEGLEEIEYTKDASIFYQIQLRKSKHRVQFFNKGMVILSTFANDSDDIEFGVRSYNDDSK